MMLRPFGGGGPVQHEFRQTAAQVQALRGQGVPAARAESLNAVGVRVLSWGQQDFRAKSKGETAGGIGWRPITESAIVSRLAQRAPYQRNLAGRRELTRQEQSLKKDLRLPRGAGNARRRRAMLAAWLEKHGPEIAAIRLKRAQLYLARDVMIATEWSKAKIGIDTGRLAAALKAGRNADQIFEQTDTSVTVGARVMTATGKNYAAFFDLLRPIFGPGFIDERRLEQLEELAVRVYERRVKQLEGK